MRAFALLDPRNEGYFTPRVWERFVRHLIPGSSKAEARIRFAMLDLDGNGKIDALDFLQIRSQLEVRLHEVRPPRLKDRTSKVVFQVEEANRRRSAETERRRTQATSQGESGSGRSGGGSPRGDGAPLGVVSADGASAGAPAGAPKGRSLLGTGRESSAGGEDSPDRRRSQDPSPELVAPWRRPLSGDSGENLDGGRETANSMSSHPIVPKPSLLKRTSLEAQQLVKRASAIPTRSLEVLEEVDAEYYARIDSFASTVQLIMFCMVWPERDALLLAVLAHVSLGFACLSTILLLLRTLSVLHRASASAVLLQWDTRADAVAILVCIPLYAVVYGALPAGPRAVSSFEWVWIPQLILALRLLWLLPTIQRQLPLVLRISPIFIATTSIFALLIIMLAVLGADLFAHFDLPTAAAFDGTAWDGTAAAGTSAHPRLCPVNNHFGTFACAMGTNLQIVVTNDWHTMLHQTAVASCDATGHVSSTCAYAALAHLYFDTLFYLFNFLLGPVMLALATNALMQVTNASKQAEEQSASTASTAAGPRPGPPCPQRRRAAVGERRPDGRDRRALHQDWAPLGVPDRRRRRPPPGRLPRLDRGARRRRRRRRRGRVVRRRRPVAADACLAGRQRRAQQPRGRQRLQQQERRQRAGQPVRAGGPPRRRRSTAARWRVRAVPVGGAEHQKRRARLGRIEESTRSPMAGGGGARGPRRGSTEPRRDSCYYVQMRKRAHISVNGWQRDMMKDELRNLDIAELGELSKAAKLDETKMIDLWKDKVGAKIENPLPAPITRVNTQKLSAWGRATKRIEKQRKSERDSGESRTTSGESGGRRSRLGSVAERNNSGSPGRIQRLLGMMGGGSGGVATRKSRASKRSPLAPAAAPAPAEDGAQWVLGETTTSATRGGRACAARWRASGRRRRRGGRRRGLPTSSSRRRSARCGRRPSSS